jgi:hypothetical protein
MLVKKWTAIALAALSAIGIVALALGAPHIDKTRLRDAAGIRHISADLLDNPVAHYLDIVGHNHLDFSISYAPGLNLEDVLVELDAHDAAVQRIRLALMIVLVMLLASNVGSYLLYRRGNRSGWHLAAVPAVLSLLPFIYGVHPPVGLVVLPMIVVSIIVGVESLRASGPRTRDALQ